MGKKIALQLFGQLRFWPEQKTITPFIEKLKKYGYSVDIYGTFWNDEYTQKQFIPRPEVDIFKKLNLIQEPDDAQPQTLEKYYYSLSQSNLYRSNEGIDYDLIIAMRPDLNIFTDSMNEDDVFKNIFNILDKVNKKPTLFHTHHKIVINKSGCELRMEDKIIIANPPAIDKLSNIYSNYHSGNDKSSAYHSYNFQYHSSLLRHVKKLDILEIYRDDWKGRFEFDLIRNMICEQNKFDSDVYIGDLFLRDEAKKFQDYNSFLSWMDKMNILLKKIKN
tara:strand:- start:329 stop:1156 length:828 start_codon:yes stop_codon:yes gene_type:complete